MRKKSIISTMMLLLLLAGPPACNREDYGPRYPHMQERIAGKWQQTAEGWIDHDGAEQFKEVASDVYTEYRPDWKINSFDWQSRRYRDDRYVYRIDSEFLYTFATDPEEEGDREYKYTFTGEDELRLDYRKGFMTRLYPSMTIGIFRRIK
jgi:hypothetical protein